MRGAYPGPSPCTRHSPAPPPLRGAYSGPSPLPAHTRLLLCAAQSPADIRGDLETQGGNLVAIISALNQKGGVGKTSTCFHLAGTLAQLGRRVLLVDADPQASLSQGFLGPQLTRQLDPAETIAAVLAGDAIPDRVLRPTAVGGIDLLAGSRQAASVNVPDPHRADWPAQVAVRDFLDEVRGRYDLILIDCPPNLHLCSWAALVASDALVVPVMPEDFGAQGLADVQESIARVQAGPNPALVPLGYLVTMIERPPDGPPGLCRAAPRDVRRRRLRDDDPRGRRLRGGDRPAGARRAVQAAGDRRPGDEGPGRRAARPAGGAGRRPRKGGRLMGKREEILRQAAGHIDESVGGPRQSTPGDLATATAPARWQGVAKSKSAVEIPLEKIGRDPTQPREEFDPEALDRLAASLKAKGLLQPIRVRWSDEQAQYILIAGERRWRAAQLAGLRTLTAIVVEGTPDPGELLALQLIENCLREDLKPLEQARAYRRLMDLHGWSGNQLAKELAIAQGTVSRALALLDLPAAVRAQVEQGTLAPSVAYEVAKLDDPGDQAALVGQAVAEKLTRAAVREVVQARTGGRMPGRSRPRRVEFQAAGGRKVAITLGPDDGPDAVIAALEDALAQARAASRAPARGEAA